MRPTIGRVALAVTVVGAGPDSVRHRSPQSKGDWPFQDPLPDLLVHMTFILSVSSATAVGRPSCHVRIMVIRLADRIGQRIQTYARSTSSLGTKAGSTQEPLAHKVRSCRYVEDPGSCALHATSGARDSIRLKDAGVTLQVTAKVTCDIEAF